MPRSKALWRHFQEVRVNIGGLKGNVYILQRSANPYRPPVRYAARDAEKQPCESNLDEPGTAEPEVTNGAGDAMPSGEEDKSDGASVKDAPDEGVHEEDAVDAGCATDVPA
jgi:hypothetical protein